MYLLQKYPFYHNYCGITLLPIRDYHLLNIYKKSKKKNNEKKKIRKLREQIKQSIIETLINDVQEGWNMSSETTIARIDFILGDYKESSFEEFKKDLNL